MPEPEPEPWEEPVTASWSPAPEEEAELKAFPTAVNSQITDAVEETPDVNPQITDKAFADVTPQITDVNPQITDVSPQITDLTDEQIDPSRAASCS